MRAGIADAVVDEQAEEEKRKKMREGWSERDRGLLDQAQAEVKAKLDAARKALAESSDDTSSSSGAGGEGTNKAKSRQNMLVSQIENDPNLSEAEKEALLRNHFQSMSGIDEMMDAEKRRQDSELEKAIKDRADRRRKALEAKHKKEINAEIKEGEQEIKIKIESRKIEVSKEIDQDIDKRLDEAARSDKNAYKRSVDELKKERVE